MYCRDVGEDRRYLGIQPCYKDLGIQAAERKEKGSAAQATGISPDPTATLQGFIGGAVEQRRAGLLP